MPLLTIQGNLHGSVGIPFNNSEKFTEEKFMVKWDAAILKSSKISLHVTDFYSLRKVVEDDKFWTFLGNTIAKSRKLDQFS